MPIINGFYELLGKLGTPEEEEAMAELAVYDDELYREHQAQIKRPADEMKKLLEQTFRRRRSGNVI
jgi:hypothetical protein